MIQSAIKPHGNRFRPLAAFHFNLKMLQRRPSLRPFVHGAAFCRLKRRYADKVCFAVSMHIVRSVNQSGRR